MNAFAALHISTAGADPVFMPSPVLNACVASRDKLAAQIEVAQE
jgi:hypothetical protein